MEDVSLQYYALECEEGTRYVAHLFGDNFAHEGYSGKISRTAQIINEANIFCYKAIINEAPELKEIFSRMGAKPRPLDHAEEMQFLSFLGSK